MMEHTSPNTPSYDAYALDVVLWMKQQQQQQQITTSTTTSATSNKTEKNNHHNNNNNNNKSSSYSNSTKDRVSLILFQLLNSKNLSSSSSSSSLTTSTTTVHPLKQINALLKIDDNTNNIHNNDMILLLNRHILTQSSFITITDKALQTLLHMSTDPLPIIRAKVMRTLLQLMQIDEDLINRDSIRVTITNRLFDKAISVREETVKLLGHYVIKGR